MARTKTSVTLEEGLLAEARALGLNVSASAARGLTADIRDERRRRLEEELRPTIDALNAHFAENGLPLAKVRAFFPQED